MSPTKPTKPKPRVVYRKPKLLEMLPLITTLLTGVFAIGNTMVNKFDFSKSNSFYEARINELEQENEDLRFKLAILSNLSGADSSTLMSLSQVPKSTSKPKSTTAPTTVKPTTTVKQSTSPTVVSKAMTIFNTMVSAIKDNILIVIITVFMVIALTASFFMIRTKMEKD